MPFDLLPEVKWANSLVIFDELSDRLDPGLMFDFSNMVIFILSKMLQTYLSKIYNYIYIVSHDH